MSNRRPNGEDIRASLWFWPAIASVAAFALTLVVLQIRPAPESLLGTIAWPGSVDAASTMLQAVATSAMAAMTLTFSLTVVALQLASQQFSPRLLREFARDRVTHVVLALLLSTFVASLTAMRGIDPDRPLPVLAVSLSFLLGVAAAGALVAFVGHIARALRVDTMMVAVHAETSATIERTYPAVGEGVRGGESPVNGRPGSTLTAPRSGFVRVIRPEVLVAAAQRADAFVELSIRPGDHVTEGTPVGRVVSQKAPVDAAAFADAVTRAVDLGFERTVEEDAALGLRQLTDIAVKAISPSINDPATAVHAIGYCADLLRILSGVELGGREHRDEDGTSRLFLPDRDYRYYLDLVVGPIRRYGSGEPLVIFGLLRAMRDAARSASTDEQRREVRHQTDLIMSGIDKGLNSSDLDEIRDHARRVELALDGRIEEAYTDRAGETRST